VLPFATTNNILITWQIISIYSRVNERGQMWSQTRQNMLVKSLRLEKPNRSQLFVALLSFTINGPTTRNNLQLPFVTPDLSQNTFMQALRTYLFSTAQQHATPFTWFRCRIQIITRTYLLTYIKYKSKDLTVGVWTCEASRFDSISNRTSDSKFDS